jgi:hypothetical protein
MAEVRKLQIRPRQVGSLAPFADKMVVVCLQNFRKLLALVANSRGLAQALASSDQI